jgi:hypothetical protein
VYNGYDTEMIQQAIDKITETMKGSLPDIERSLLHAERKDLRQELWIRENFLPNQQVR